MAAYLDPSVFNAGLTAFHNNATTLWIDSTQPTTYTQATSTYALGSNVVAAGSCVGAPAAGSPSGQQVTVAAVNSGNVGATGLAGFYGITDSVSVLYAGNALSSLQSVASGSSFNLPSFIITVRGAT